MVWWWPVAIRTRSEETLEVRRSWPVTALAAEGWGLVIRREMAWPWPVAVRCGSVLCGCAVRIISVFCRLLDSHSADLARHSSDCSDNDVLFIDYLQRLKHSFGIESPKAHYRFLQTVARPRS